MTQEMLEASRKAELVQQLASVLEREIANAAGQITDVGKIRIPISKPEPFTAIEKPA